MRSHNDLFGAFDSVDTDSVDPEEMLARVHTGTAALQTARRRRIAVLSVAAAAVLIAVGAVVVPSLGNDRSDRGQVANTPSPEQEPPSTVAALPSLGLSFVVRESPEGLPIRHLSASLGSQMLTFWPSDPTISGELVVRLYDPESSGVEAPELTGESVAVDSVSEGLVTADVIASTPQGELEEFGIGWQTENGHWLTVVGQLPQEWSRKVEAVRPITKAAISPARGLAPRRRARKKISSGRLQSSSPLQRLIERSRPSGPR